MCCSGRGGVGAPQDLPPLRPTASLGWPQAPGTAFSDGQALQGICTEKCKYTVPKHTTRFSNDSGHHRPMQNSPLCHVGRILVDVTAHIITLLSEPNRTLKLATNRTGRRQTRLRRATKKSVNVTLWDRSTKIDLGHTVTSSYKGEGSPEREVFFISPSAEFYFLNIILKNFKPIETVEDIMDSNIHISPRFTYC